MQVSSRATLCAAPARPQAPRPLATFPASWPAVRRSCRASAASASAGAGGGSSSPTSSTSMQRAFQQHAVLMSIGFTHHQASLILQVAEAQQQQQQHANAPAGLAGDVPLAAAAAAAADIAPAPPAATTSTTSTSSSGGEQAPGLPALEARIAFLELELLKQSLAAATAAAGAGPAGGVNAAAVGGGRRSSSSAGATGSLLSSAGAGASGLSAAAAAQQRARNADAGLRRQRPPPAAAAAPGSYPWLGSFPDLPDSRTAGLFTSGMPPAAAPGGGGWGGPMPAELAAAAAVADLQQLDPEVAAIADALTVRQGLGSLQEARMLAAFAAAAAELEPPPHAQQQPASVWGRSATTWQSKPLAARGHWGEAGGYGGEPPLAPGDLDDVPYQPSGWAVVGTIAVVYLGVIATFLAMCIGDVGPY